MLPHCDFQAEYAHVHEVKHYTGIKEVCMYMSEASVVWKYPCLDQWINQHTCTHTLAGVFLKGVSSRSDLVRREEEETLPE